MGLFPLRLGAWGRGMAPLQPEPPVCPTCQTKMRLERVEPGHYVNLRLWCYSCPCGGESQQFVADPHTYIRGFPTF